MTLRAIPTAALPVGQARVEADGTGEPIGGTFAESTEPLRLISLGSLFSAI